MISFISFSFRGIANILRSQYNSKAAVKEMLDNRCEWELYEDEKKRVKEQQQQEDKGYIYIFHRF